MKNQTLLTFVGIGGIMLVIGAALGSAIFPATKFQTSTSPETITLNHTTTVVSVPRNETYFAFYNETCDVLVMEVLDPAPWQYPFGTVSTCCTIFTFTDFLTSYNSTVPIVRVLFPSYIMINNGTETQTNSGYNGIQWTETACTFTG
jgi:hypothetical protein